MRRTTVATSIHKNNGTNDKFYRESSISIYVYGNV